MTIDLVTLGEAMGLLTPTEPGPLLRKPLLRLGFGGAETNLAIGASRLGLRTHWIGRVGDDEIGDVIVRELRAEGVSSSCVRDPAPTGLMIKTVGAAGKVRVTYVRSASAGSHLCVDDIDETVIRGAKVLHITGITPALGDEPAAAVAAAVEIARAGGVIVSLDLNYRSALWDPRTAAAALGPLVERADVLFSTQEEARLLVDEVTPADCARALSSLGPSQVMVKLGAEGSVAVIDGELYRQEAEVVTAVDPVGAGDAFAAGYLSELVRGVGPRGRLSTAAKAGAFAVTVSGDWEGLPTRSDLRDFEGREDILR
ncbi:sugar kinase [Streptosporangium carneum]|uniref:Sugar kinase n=1 Tax=Streptosporangium carneum TaxID=47481 RepID=A0A9W6I661_9ACTN|nr:sugar kinase [Streptosporangium carneum]GLK12766.1 sugar kinase [Streptosporangium carneum]